MAFNPNEPQNGEVVDADFLRAQLNDLNARLVAAMAALDWSNGAPKLPSFEAITNPVAGNIALDYGADYLMVYDGEDWQTLA